MPVNPIGRAFALTLLLASAATFADDKPNTLSDAEKAAGWRLLFDGTSTQGWRAFKKQAFPAQGWIVRDGCLGHLGKAGGGDIVTIEKFSDYDLTFDWRINSGGNSGLKYFIDESRDGAIGHEYQLLGPVNDEEARKDPKHATASFYDVLPVGHAALPKPPGEWNHSRIRIQGNQVEHWLNGAKVLTYELGSTPVTEGIAKSKFKAIAGFGTKFSHPILLQDHGGEIWFRNLKIRPGTP